jgi:hypothetical protein
VVVADEPEDEQQDHASENPQLARFCHADLPVSIRGHCGGRRGGKSKANPSARPLSVLRGMASEHTYDAAWPHFCMAQLVTGAKDTN